MTKKPIKNVSASVRAKLLDAPAKQVQWKAFISRTSTASGALDLSSVVDQIRVFLVPILEGLAGPASNPREWNPETGWTPA